MSVADPTTGSPAINEAKAPRTTWTQQDVSVLVSAFHSGGRATAIEAFNDGKFTPAQVDAKLEALSLLKLEPEVTSNINEFVHRLAQTAHPALAMRTLLQAAKDGAKMVADRAATSTFDTSKPNAGTPAVTK